LKSFALFIALYLFLGGLTPGQDYVQLARLAKLAEHFQLHRNTAGGSERLSALEFLWEHFVQPNGHQHDQGNEHSELPFQSLNSGMTLSLLCSCPQPIVSQPGLYSKAQFYYRSPMIRDHRMAIFRPPLPTDGPFHRPTGLGRLSSV